MKIIYITIGIIALIVFPVFGQSYHSTVLLDMPSGCNSAAVSAMGNVNIIAPEGAANAVLSPANLPSRCGFYASFQSKINYHKEKRAMPLFDSFNDQVAMSIYNSNNNSYLSGSAFVGYRLKGEWSPTLAIGYGPVYDSRYNYSHMVRNSDDEYQYTDAITNEGMLSGPTFATGMTLSKWGRIGMGISILSGEYEFTSSDTVQLLDLSKDVVNFGDDLSATVLMVNGVFTPTNRIELGFSYSPSAELEGSDPYPHNLPSKLGFAVGFRPSGYEISHIIFEAEQIGYEDISDTYKEYAYFDNTWAFRFGIEHILPSGVPIRAGAYHYEIPISRAVTRTGLTCGSGFKIPHATVNFGVGYLMSTYDQHQLFSKTTDTESEEIIIDEVRETGLYGNIGINIEF